MEWLLRRGAGSSRWTWASILRHEGGRDVITLGDGRQRIARRTRRGLAEVRASGRRTGVEGQRLADLVERISATRAENDARRRSPIKPNERASDLRGSDAAAVERAGVGDAGARYVMRDEF